MFSNSESTIEEKYEESKEMLQTSISLIKALLEKLQPTDLLENDPEYLSQACYDCIEEGYKFLSLD